MTETATSTATWDAAFAALKARHPNAKDSIVFCIHALQSNPDIALDDLKAQASMHGVRVTAASVTAAQRLMSPKAEASPAAQAQPPAPAPARVRRPRAPAKEIDAEALIKQVVGKIQEQGSAESERLRDAVRKAIAVLQAAVG